MRANTIALTVLVLLLAVPILACGGGSSSGGSSDVPLQLLPDDTDLVEVLAVSEILGGDVPEVVEEEFDKLWENFSVGDDHLLINDVDKLFRVLGNDGVFLIIVSSQMDFLETREWLSDQESTVESTSYQGEDLWESAGQAMVLLENDGYLIAGDTEAVKNLLKVKARGEGSLDQDDENVVRQALDDAGSGWYVMADKNCGGAWSELRGCEAYSITGSAGEKEFEAAVTYRFRFRSESRAEDQELEVEDLLDDWIGGDADLETDSSGATISVLATADQEDFQTRWLGGYVDQPPPPLPGKTSPETDRQALIALYDATDGENWRNHTNWLSDAPTGEWSGVTTNAEGRVTELLLAENRLSGEIPPELGNLANLTDLDLSFNQLSGQIPLELGNLANLEQLALQSNQLSGEIPPELGSLSNLESLVLGGNQLSGEIPPELGNLANLEQLALQSNQLSGEIPPELGSLGNLESLVLEGNQLSGEIPPALDTVLSWSMQSESAHTPEPSPNDFSSYMAVINTNQGPITVELYAEEAPQTVDNFITLAEEGFYNGVIFHRVIPEFMIQGGDPTGTGGGGPGYQFDDEISPDLSFDSPGILAMANAGANTNGSQFFITVAPTPHLTGGHTIFGKVTDGQDVADAISIVPTAGANRPISDVIINTIEVIKDAG